MRAAKPKLTETGFRTLTWRVGAVKGSSLCSGVSAVSERVSRVGADEQQREAW